MAHIAGAGALIAAGFPTRIWPPECCVPAFVHNAMVVKGVALDVPDILPSKLGVRVRPDQDNPLGLALADDRYPPGIRSADAEQDINRCFVELGITLRFRHIMFLAIALGLWEEVLDVALARSVVVGLGVDFGVLMKRTSTSPAEHVQRVISRNGDRLELVDDSGETIPARYSASTDQISRAVLAIPDGFWMIGAKHDLQLPYTLPWRGDR